MTDYASEWIARAQSLTQVHPFPLGDSITSHMDMLLRDTRQDLLVASGALEAVLKLHAPLDVEKYGMSVQVCYHCHEIVLDVINEAFDGDHYGPVLWPCATVQAITSALVFETGSNHE